MIVASFRGTATLLGWIVNFTFKRVPTNLCADCGAHEGFWNTWLGIRDIVLTAVRDAVAANPGYAIVSVGHSQGAAIASLAAADLRNTGYNVALVRLPHITYAHIHLYIDTIIHKVV